ncbi:CBS domain-containing protein [Hippea maritima]|uniref:Polynucleotide adenylyltransferase region n=1 Tax=Hippea maritima (strain ATCC 700847 / DSM 10411 / MH2) TaxID=760142 RepID=F2LX26_HIPMA|nr:CBS domain-containing protein [Hippea maritima]AEA33084.1 Polynucleotide adenylyltransferase region [Hippea maritima DSM 10411]
MKAITAHKNPDFDAIASCVAAKKLYPDAVILFPQFHGKGNAQFILQSLIYPFLEEAEHVDLNSIDTLIVVDTHSSKRIEPKYRPLLKKAKIICYDHHEEGDLACEQTHLVKYGANTTQLVEKIIKNGIEIDEEEATLFMLGIYADTGRLTFSSTTPNDIKAAAFLLEKGADLETVKEVLEEALTETDVIILNDLIKNKRIYEIGKKRIGLSFSSLDEYVANVSNLVGKLINIDRLDAAIAVFRMGSRLYIIGRSNDKEIDVSRILKEVGGGGHPQAASATIKDATLIDTTEKLSQLIKEELLGQIKAKDIMSFPPKFVYATDSIEKVNELISKSGMNALVVVCKETGDVMGIITRQVINKAIFHNMHKKTVSLFMNTEIKTVDVEENFNNIKRIVLDEKQRLIPVLERGKLVGVITRTNLLKILSETINREKPLKLQNISSRVKGTLPKNALEYLKEIGELAKSMGYNAYLVGGIIRDIILGWENLDIDIVIEGDGIVFAKEFAKIKQAKVATHERFKTATLVMKDGMRIDIATAREEYYDLPGALPVVEKSSIKLDLYRRDFTINALAMKLHDEFGDLLDFFGGLNDIKNKKIRVLHMLSFVDDPTRMYRAVRFAARLGFDIGQQTDRLIKVAVELGIVNKVEKIRIFNEIVHILNNDNVKSSFEMLKSYRLIRTLDNKLIIDDRILSYIDEAEEIVKSCSIFCKNKKIKRERVFLILLEYLFGKSTSFSKAVGADDQTYEFVKNTSKKIPIANGILSKKNVNDLEIYEALSKIPLEGILALYPLTKEKERLIRYLEDLMHREPIIKGKDLIKLGFKPSKIFGQMINDIFKQQLLGKIKDKIEAIKYIEENYKNANNKDKSSELANRQM